MAFFFINFVVSNGITEHPNGGFDDERMEARGSLPSSPKGDEA